MYQPNRPPTIRAATADQTEAYAAMVADCLGRTGPLAEWLVADEQRRARLYHRYWRTEVEHALRPGSRTVVDVAVQDETVGAAAFWYPVAAGGQPDLAVETYEKLLTVAAGDGALHRWQHLDLLVARVLPKPGRDWMYLGCLAVRPDRQRHGLGTALLEYRHARLDATATPAGLLAFGDATARLYRRHGYRHHNPPVPVDDTAWRLYPMLRQPRVRD